MSDGTYEIEKTQKPVGTPSGPTKPTPTVVVNVPPPNRGWGVRLLLILLAISVLFNIQASNEKQQYYSGDSKVTEKYHSGSRDAEARVVRIVVNGTIMPPFTDSTLKMIQHARKDERVKGVLLIVNSPGGLVTSSHQIYHELKQLTETKPVYVSMKDMATSGGYYISMGAGVTGKIYAEPTTWTGSIGVILPRYNVSEMATKLGVKVESLKTGPLKDSLSPFRELSEEDRTVWNAIIDDSFGRFIGVIDENRNNLNEAQVRELATGQIYTATQAKEKGLVDEIGFEADALAALIASLQLTNPRIVTYEGPVTLLDIFAGTAQAQSPADQWRGWMELTVPRAMYYCSWLPVLPGTGE